VASLLNPSKTIQQNDKSVSINTAVQRPSLKRRKHQLKSQRQSVITIEEPSFEVCAVNLRALSSTRIGCSETIEVNHQKLSSNNENQNEKTEDVREIKDQSLINN